MKRDPSLRSPLVEGLFYPADPEQLSSDLGGYLTGERGSAPALILPHASYSLIGLCSGEAWMRSADRSVKRVLVLAPAHREPQTGLFLPPYERFASPLGDISLDRKLLDSLEAASPHCRRELMPFEEEHSLELTVPFIKTLFPEALLIPLLVGTIRRRERKELAKGLRELLMPLRENLLTVISTNYSRFTTPDVSRREADNFAAYLDGDPEPRDISACGRSALDLFRETGLYEGRFRELTRFEETRRENRKPASVHYGTGYFAETPE